MNLLNFVVILKSNSFSS